MERHFGETPKDWAKREVKGIERDLKTSIPLAIDAPRFYRFMEDNPDVDVFGGVSRDEQIAQEVERMYGPHDRRFKTAIEIADRIRGLRKQPKEKLK